MNITTEPRFAKVEVIQKDGQTQVEYINIMDVHSITPIDPSKNYKNAAHIEFISDKKTITITDVGDFDI